MGRGLIAAAVLITLSGGLAYADDDWVGFYKAIDGIDGSIDSLSIVPNQDGTYRILMSSTKLGACADGAQGGVILARGRILDGQLVREEVTYRCDGSDVEKGLPNSTYTRDDETGILTLNGPMGRVNHYHPVGGDGD